MFDKYLPSTILEMKKNFSHVTPLGTMNFIMVSQLGLGGLDAFSGTQRSN
jgi:hypothetical protein